MKRQVITLEGIEHKHPIPLAVKIGPLVVSGNVSGIDRATKSYPDDVREQIRNAFDNVEAVLGEVGCGLESIAKLEVLLEDRDDRVHLDAEWLERFPDAADRPARHTDAKPLPGAMRVQLAITAWSER